MAMKSQGTKLQIETGTGSAKTIEGVVVGYPTILESTAHGLSAGNVVTLSLFAGDDAALLNGKTVTVKYITTDTFAVGIDTTGKDINDDTESALATPVAYTDVGEFLSWSGPTASKGEIETTHLQSTAKEFLAALPDNGTIDASTNFLTTDNGQDACFTSFLATEGDTVNWKLIYSNGAVLSFPGYVSAFPSSGGVDGKVEGSITVRITGAMVPSWL